MKLHVIHYSADSDLPASVRESMPDGVAQTIFRAALNSHLCDGGTEMHAYIRAYRVLEDAGYQYDEAAKVWTATATVEKDSPTVVDVHVNKPIGAVKLVLQGTKSKRKDAPGMQDVNLKEDDEEEKPVVKADKITVDVPLFIRLLETAREDVKQDEPLHVMTERITALLEKKPALDMSDYAAITAEVKKTIELEKIAKRISGQSPIPLNAKGEKLADKLGQRIAAKGGLDVLHSSPLLRAVQTANAIAEHNPEMKREEPADALRPWRLGQLEGKQPEDVKVWIEYFVERPDERTPGKGNDGEPGESFGNAKIRQLDYLLNEYVDSEIHPDAKIGIVMHSRGMELLQSWVDAGCPEDYALDTKDTFHPDDPEHADVLRWRDGKVEEIDMSADGELESGVYLILHSLTDDDTDEGNQDLEKYSEDQERVPAGDSAGGQFAGGGGEADSHWLDNNKDLPQWQAKAWTAQTNKLGANIKNAVSDYQESGLYDPLNIYLRTGELRTSFSPEMADSVFQGDAFNAKQFDWQVEQLDKAFQDARAPGNVVVYRGLDHGALVDIKPGMQLIDKGYASTSFKKSVAEGFAGPKGSVLSISVKNGARALYVDPITNLKQREVVLPRNSVMTVVSVRNYGGRQVINAEYR
jgi:broad specificity phosphatase PhoE